MLIAKKLFVVTGAGNGIGNELAKVLLAKKAFVVAVDVNRNSLRMLQEQCSNNRTTLITHQADITDRRVTSTLPETILKNQGRIDGLINCAGIIQPFQKFINIDYDHMEKVMNVNFWGTLNMTKAFLPHLLERPEASLVNFSSMGGFVPVPGQGIYGASKAAVKLFSESLSAELTGRSIQVLTVFPGATNTNIAKNSGIKMPNSNEIKEMQKKIPTTSPRKVAELVVEAIEKNKSTLITGRDAKFMNFLYRLAPNYAHKTIAKKMNLLLTN